MEVLGRFPICLSTTFVRISGLVLLLIIMVPGTTSSISSSLLPMIGILVVPGFV